MFESRWKKYAVAIGAAAATILFIGNIKIDVPPHLRGELFTQGRISHCDFQGLGRHNAEVFVGFTIDTPGAPYLRLQAPSDERDMYEGMCARRPFVRITYHAVKRVFGPVRFWIDRVSED